MVSYKYSLINFTSNLPWSTMWKRNQMMMEYLSRNDTVDRVVYVNPDIWLWDMSFKLRMHMSLSNHKLYRFSLKAVFPRRVNKKIYTTTPLYFIPFLRRNKFLSQFQTNIQYQIIKSLTKSEKVIIFLNEFSYNPERKRLIERFIKKAKLIVYDWSDDFVEFFKEREGREKVRRTCEEYIKRAHVVFAVNDNLAKRAQKINSHSYTAINATDFNHMSQACSPDFKIPQALKSISKPILGYIGWITATRIDAEMLKQVAALHPEWTIVLIGPVGQKFVDEFQKIKNIVFLPPVNYFDLPRYLKFFDVCLIPHHVNDHTMGNNPIKIYDYLATGKPVVSTSVAGVETLSNLIYVASNPLEFCSMVERALKENMPKLYNQRLTKAKENSWPVRIEEVWKIMDNYLHK